MVLLQFSQAIPGRNGSVSWECLWRSQWWPQHWFVVLLSPLAWPWPEEQTHTVAQKAWLRLVTSSLLGNVIVPHKTFPDRHLSPLQWRSGRLIWPRSLCIHTVTGLSPAVTGELVARIFRLKPLCMLSHTDYLSHRSIFLELEVNRSNSSPFSSDPVAAGLCCACTLLSLFCFF